MVRSCENVLLIICFMFLSLSANAYKNYTVGESTGWFDIQERPSANYQKWADSKSFSLGDFLSKFKPSFLFGCHFSKFVYRSVVKL